MSWRPLALVALLAACGGRSAVAGSSHDSGGDSSTLPARGCRGARVAVQVLGSGGPIPDDGRASSAYLLWEDGRARALLDAGGGLLPRFGASGAQIADIDVVALTHLHADHSAGLAAWLKGGYFSQRDRPLPVLGPGGNDAYPPVDELVASMVGPAGAFRYLHGYVDGDDPFALEPRVVSGDAGAPVYEGPRLRLEARTVRHGNVPALGYLATIGGVRVAFTGDQSATGREAFAALIEGADVLIAHHAVSEDASEQLRTLHATPSELGALAGEAQVGRLVLSHNMRRALDDRERGLSAIRESYAGPVDIANDLDCFQVR